MAWGKLSLAEGLQGEGLVNGSEGCPLLFKEANNNSSFITIWSRNGATKPWKASQFLFCISGRYKEGKDMFFNPKVEWQAQAKTDYNKASDIIGKADRKNV